MYRNISDLDNILSYSEQEHVKGGRVRLTNSKRVYAMDSHQFSHLGRCRGRWSPRTRGCKGGL